MGDIGGIGGTGGTGGMGGIGIAEVATSAEAMGGAIELDQTLLSGEVFGALINLTGRRSFNSQRLVLIALHGLHGEPDAINTARDALRLFRDTHATLVQGDRTLPGIFCPEYPTTPTLAR